MTGQMPGTDDRFRDIISPLPPFVVQRGFNKPEDCTYQSADALPWHTKQTYVLYFICFLDTAQLLLVSNGGTEN